MSEIRIKVGASVDRSLATAFQPLIEAAKGARRIVDKEAKERARSERQAEKEIAQWARSAEREKQAERAKSARAAKSSAQEAARIDREAAREAERTAKQVAQAKERAAKDALERIRQANVRAERERAHEAELADRRSASRMRTAGRIGSAVAGVGGRALGFGRQVLGDLARGAGLQLDLGSHLSNAMSVETQAVQLSNAGYMPGGTRADPKALQQQAYSVAQQTGMSAGDVMTGMQKFVGKTGDLDTAQQIIKSMGVISKATGASMEDMADAAGDVSNNLGDVPNKAQVIEKVMKGIAAQGKVGAVEIKDLASQMAKVASAANQFEGAQDASIAKFGALAQYTRQKGGSASATQAATSVMSFMNTFSKGARLDAFTAHGVKVQGAGGKIRDPEEIILDALSKTRGNTKAMGEMFMDVRARSVVRPFESKYREEFEKARKGGASEEEANQRAIAATREEFDKLKNATMDETELMDSFNAAMKTSETQAQQFNTQLDELTNQAKGELLPAFQQLTPAIIGAAKAITDFLVPAAKTQAAADASAQAASNAGQTLEQKVFAGQPVTQEDIDKAKKQLATSEGALAKQKANVEKGRGGAGTLESLAIGGYGQAVSDPGSVLFQPWNVIKGAKQYKNDTERNARASEDDYKRNEEQVTKLREMLDHLENGTLNVRIVATPPAAPAPNLTQGK